MNLSSKHIFKSLSIKEARTFFLVLSKSTKENEEEFIGRIKSCKFLYLKLFYLNFITHASLLKK